MKIIEISRDNVEKLVALRVTIDELKDGLKLATEVAKYAAGNRRRAFVFEDGGCAIGYIEVNLDETKLPVGAPPLTDRFNFGHIARIGVTKEARSKGVATMLLSHAEEWLWSHGKNAVWLDYLAINEPAYRLYASNGYHDVAEFKESDGDRLRRIAVKHMGN